MTDPVYPTIADCVGQTPLVRLQRMLEIDNGSQVLLKLEGNNPAGSVKDRPALSMIQQAQARGDISPGDTLIEATSGNTGIALAMAAAIMGYRMILIMPDNATMERRWSMEAYGAELILVSKEEGMEGARDLALRMESDGKGVVLNQFGNLDNPEAYAQTRFTPVVPLLTGKGSYPAIDRDLLASELALNPALFEKNLSVILHMLKITSATTLVVRAVWSATGFRLIVLNPQ